MGNETKREWDRTKSENQPIPKSNTRRYLGADGMGIEIGIFIAAAIVMLDAIVFNGKKAAVTEFELALRMLCGIKNNGDTISDHKHFIGAASIRDAISNSNQDRFQKPMRMLAADADEAVNGIYFEAEMPAYRDAIVTALAAASKSISEAVPMETEADGIDALLPLYNLLNGLDGKNPETEKAETRFPKRLEAVAKSMGISLNGFIDNGSNTRRKFETAYAKAEAVNGDAWKKRDRK